MTRDRSYSYDELERLTEVAVPTSPTQDETYTLDPEGNRISSHLSDMHQTDEANRLTSDDNYTYVYDLNGNLISKLAKAGTGLSDWSYSYDALDQLIEVTQDTLPNKKPLLRTLKNLARRDSERKESDIGIVRFFSLAIPPC